MKKIFILLASIIFLQDFHGQHLIVEYLSIKKSAEQNYTTFLIDGAEGIFNINVFHKTYSDYNELLKDDEFLRSSIYVSSLKKVADNIFLGTVFFKKNAVFYKDIIKPIEWKIKTEFKEVLGYKCRLAIGTFRGREYKAWYAEEIPISEGPWKLGGLPGLILSAETAGFSFEALKINMNSEVNIPEKYIKMYSQNAAFIDYKTFIQLENEYYKEVRDIQIANLPKNIVLSGTPPIRSELIEREFEWEEN